MRSSLTESRPVSDVNTYSSWPDSGSQHANRPQPHIQPRRQLSLISIEGWFALLLLAVAVYSVVYAVTVAIAINHTPVLWIMTALGLLSGLVVSKIHVFPQAILHICACLVGYWLALFLISTLAYQVSMLELLSSLKAFIMSGLVLTKSQDSDMVFLFYLSFLCFFLGYFGAWLVYRAHLPWLVALVYVSIMLVDLNYISKRDLSFLMVILVGSLILLIARVQLASQLSQWQSDGLYTDQAWLRGISGRFLSIASLFVLLILPFSWILPVVTQPSAGVRFWNGLDNATINLIHGHLPSLSNPSDLFNPYSPPSNFFSDQLAITGSVNLPKGSVLAYHSSDSRGHYLESFIYDNFDGHTWTTQVANVSRFYNPNVQLPTDNPDVPYDPLTTAVTIIQPPDGTKSFLFAPPQPLVFNVPVTLITDTAGDLISSWTQNSPLSQNEQYEVRSGILHASPSDFSSVLLPKDNRAAWSEIPDFRTIQEYYLQLPTNLSSEVLATAQEWTAGAHNTYAAVSALQSHLSNTADFTYSLTNDPVPSDVDAVTWLLHTHKGFCTYYATAMVIMARLLDIPARMVNGFSQGHYDAQQKAWVVDGNDAHSWVQIYFPNYGWVNFDPTPSFSVSSGAEPDPSPQPQVTPTPAPGSPTVTVNQSTSGSQPTPATKHPAGSPASSPADSTSGGNLLIDFSLIILLCSFVVLGLVLARSRLSRSSRSPTSLAYARLCRLASLVGSPPAVWQTPYEYVSVLSKRFPQASSALHRLTDLFVRESWASPQQAPVPVEQREAERLWPSLRNAILRKPFFKGR
jgi:transglutaminase-like putative cysteine protease